jgi:hypothetical protein
MWIIGLEEGSMGQVERWKSLSGRDVGLARRELIIDTMIDMV